MPELTPTDLQGELRAEAENWDEQETDHVYQLMRRAADKIDALTKERDAALAAQSKAEAELAKLREQKPVGYANKEHLQECLTTLWTTQEGVDDVPLYAHPVPEQPAWQPIETAPKDRPILLCMPICGNMTETDRRVFEGRWNEVQQTWSAPSGFILLTEVTHWMPMPTAPVNQSEGL
jgi:hypothetical protein